ncbi:MAG: NAD+ synthase [Bacteroidales bacterium]|nr:NAD+ synthase [Bacteroidales bacterium]
MKIAIAQNNYKVGDILGNVNKITNSIQKAKEQNVDLVVFSELCICGYPPYDLLNFDSFINACENALKTISKVTENIAVIIGGPTRNPDPKGKALFNSAFLIIEGVIQNTVHKALLPDYDVFDECRYFEPETTLNVIDFKGVKIALTICEDLWNIGNEGLYKVNPMEVLKQQSPDIIINIAASPFDYEQQEKRYGILKANAEKYKTPLVYVNQVGAHTDLIFDGASLVLDSKGEVLKSLKSFEEDFAIVELQKENISKPFEARPKIELIHDALVLGIRDYFRKSGLTKAVLGLSGGIDSALTYVLAVKALGVENVFGLLMPSEFSSAHSIEDALKSVEKVGGTYEIIPIKDAFNSVSETMLPVFKDLPFNLTEENIQARLRALILMAYSNKFGHVLLNTSNKSEAAVGYGTLYGDMCGGLAVLADIYKTEVYELSKFINRNKEIIPYNSIHKAPSAELRPGQKDSDSLPEYAILDQILYRHIELAKSAKEIVSEGFDEITVLKIIRLVYLNEYKRFQAAPVLRVSPKAFGSGRKLPIVACYKQVSSI